MFDFQINKIYMETNFLGKNLKFLLEKEKRTNVFLSELTKTTKSTIGNYLNGSSYPKVDFLLTVSDYFGVSCDDLLRVDLSKGETQNNANITQHNKKGYNIVGNSNNIANEQISKLLAIIEEKDKQINKLIDKIG